MMTESEAKTKWCPFARIGVLSDDRQVACAVNRDDRLKPEEQYLKNCLAAACMAWRNGPPPPPGNSPAAETWEPTGFCGLAGRPA